MKQKSYKLELLDVPKTTAIESDVFVFYTTDTDDYLHFKMEFSDFKKLNPTKAVITLINKDDKSVINEDMPMLYAGANKYYMRPEIISHAGSWVGQIVYTSEEGKKYTSAEFSFQIRGHIIDGRDPRLVIIQDFDAMKLALETMQLSVEDVVASENERVVAEDVRKQNETTREANEADRVNGYGAFDSRITEIESDLVVRATNLIDNGDFSKGTESWSVGSNTEVVNGIAKIYREDSQGLLKQNFKVNVNDKIYIAADLATFVKGINYANISVFGKRSPSTTLSTLTNGTDIMTRTSKILTANETELTVQLGKWMNGADVDFSFDNILVINLSNTFGVGNEPSATQMDRLLTQFPNSWFEGTQNIFLARWALNELLRLDNEKANRKQEEWITPTLLNGWVGNSLGHPSVQYMKDDFGFVHIKGTVNEGVTNTVAFVLPSDYRPLKAAGNEYVCAGYSSNPPKISINGFDGGVKIINHLVNTFIDVIYKI